jgi:hypothetical protein
MKSVRKFVSVSIDILPFRKVFDIIHCFAFQPSANDIQFLALELQIFQGEYVKFLVAKGNTVHKNHLFKVTL